MTIKPRYTQGLSYGQVTQTLYRLDVEQGAVNGNASFTTCHTITIPVKEMRTVDSEARSMSLTFDAATAGGDGTGLFRVLVNSEQIGSDLDVGKSSTVDTVAVSWSIKDLNRPQVIEIQQKVGGVNWFLQNIILEMRSVVLER